MKNSSDKNTKDNLRKRIIGLGEKSVKKSYYPQLIEKIETLEKTITELENKEEELISTLHEKDQLLKEVHHRVKNNFQMILSLINLEMHYQKEKDKEISLTNISTRIQMLSLLFEMHYDENSFSKIEYTSFLQNYITKLGFMVPDNQQMKSLAVSGDTVYIQLHNAISLSLSLHEVLLFLNANISLQKDNPIDIIIKKKQEKLAVLVELKSINYDLKQSSIIEELNTHTLFHLFRDQDNIDIDITSSHSLELTIKKLYLTEHTSAD